MNIIEERKYFDYDLAYEGYKKIKELLDKGGIQEVVDDDDFDICGGGTDFVGSVEQWACNGYIPINAFGYNVTIYINDRNFDTDNKENDWYVSGEVDIYSYGGGDDTLYINDLSSIEERINELLDYAKINEYTIEDYEKELKSLERVKERLLCN